MEHNILFVDDEKNILTAMERIFHATPFNLYFSESGEEAIKLLHNVSMSVIFSDMKMPGMSGTDFLKASEDYSPDAIRIILSGYSDIHDILRAVNEGHVHNYLTKPWENDRLKIVLYNATISYEKNIQVKRLADELKDKNDQLLLMNNSLEDIVERRSRELAYRNKILLNMLQDPDISNNLTLCLELIENFLVNSHAFLHFDDEDDLGGLLDQKKTLPDNMIKVLNRIEKPSYINKYFVLPLEGKSGIDCHLVVFPVDEETRTLIPDVISLSNMIKLILQQYRNIQGSRSLMDSIDDLLEDVT